MNLREYLAQQQRLDAGYLVQEQSSLASSWNGKSPDQARVSVEIFNFDDYSCRLRGCVRDRQACSR